MPSSRILAAAFLFCCSLGLGRYYSWEHYSLRRGVAMWGNIAVGFGGLLVLAIIGFVAAWRDLERERRRRQG
jgi:hypothetical protein